MSEHTYNISSDFPNGIVNIDTFTDEIEGSSIIKELDYITVGSGDCSIHFKTDLTAGEITTLDGLVAAHLGNAPILVVPPTMSDGRPIVRADTRPLDTATYFTGASDTASGIGDGTALIWDFSPDSPYTTVSGPYTCSCGSSVPEGYKAQIIDLYFLDPVYLKDGTLYFFDAPWGQFCSMSILVPAGGYYPNEHGSIPAVALGLSGDVKYSYASNDVTFYRYVNRHHMYGSCPMGDELNAEGAMVDALPAGWFVRAGIVTPVSDNSSKGFAEFEMYRHRSVILEGDSP